MDNDVFNKSQRSGANYMTIQFKLHHVGLLVEDFDASLAFYRDTLGHQATTRCQNRDQFNVAFVGAGSDATIELVGPPFWAYEQAFIDAHGYGMNHLSFQVADADAAFEELKAKGLPVAWEPRDMVLVRQCAFYDPAGILVEVFHTLYEEMPLASPDLKQATNLAFHHIDLLTEDWRPVRAFYEEHFGMKTVFEFEDDQDGAFFFLVDPFFDFESHNFMLEIIGPPFGEEREKDFYQRLGTGIDHLAYVTDDVPGALRRSLERGAKPFVDLYTYLGADIVWIRDPDDNDIEIMSRIPREIVAQALQSGQPYRATA